MCAWNMECCEGIPRPIVRCVRRSEWLRPRARNIMEGKSTPLPGLLVFKPPRLLGCCSPDGCRYRHDTLGCHRGTSCRTYCSAACTSSCMPRASRRRPLKVGRVADGRVNDGGEDDMQRRPSHRESGASERFVAYTGCDSIGSVSGAGSV